MKKTLVLALCFFVILSSLFAEKNIQDVTTSFPADRFDSFLAGETIEVNSLRGGDASSIAFDGTVGKANVEKDSKADDNFILSLSTLIPYPEAWKNLSFDEKKLNVINTLLSVSTIKGITYISHSAGDQPKVLFEDAYTLVDAKKKKPATDAQFTYAPKEYVYEIAACLKDSIFGSNTYSINYQIKEDEIFMKITNLSDLKFLFYKCVGKEELDMCVDVLLTKDGIALFSSATVYGREPQVKTPITTVDLPSAFMKRITSLKNWFGAEIQ